MATFYLHLHVDRGFKIVFDEHAISSTAMSMHYNARAFVPAASHIINDEVVASIGFVDKRPALFPFVVSVTHSLSGYRPENVFWLNSGLTFLLLGLIYTIAARTCGKPHGILAISANDEFTATRSEHQWRRIRNNESLSNLRRGFGRA